MSCVHPVRSDLDFIITLSSAARAVPARILLSRLIRLPPLQSGTPAAYPGTGTRRAAYPPKRGPLQHPGGTASADKKHSRICHGRSAIPDLDTGPEGAFQALRNASANMCCAQTEPLQKGITKAGPNGRSGSRLCNLQSPSHLQPPPLRSYGMPRIWTCTEIMYRIYVTAVGERKRA